MGRLLVALGTGVGVTPSQLALAWDGDPESREVGRASVSGPVHGVFLPDVLDLVAIPLLVNLASSTAYDLVRRAVSSARGVSRAPAVSPADAGRGDQVELEVVEAIGGDGDLVMVVRLRGPR